MAPPRIPPPYLTLLTLLALFHSGLALQVTPGSPCANFCMDSEDSDPFSPDSSSTNATDIVCQDSLYSDSDEGAKFQSCIECLQKSEKTNGTEADNYWLLYNLRHSLGTCLYGFDDEDKVINSPCIISWACEPLEEAILSGGLDPDDDPFGYCSAGNGSLFGETLRSCVNCLKSSSDEAYLANFMVALQVGCAQEPEPGVALGISGTPFTRQNLEVTTGKDDSDKDPGASPDSLTTGAIVGIAVGAALVVFGGAALWFVHRRKRKGASSQPALWGGGDGDDNDGPGRRSRSATPMIGPGKPWMSGEPRSGASSRSSERGGDAEKGGRRVIAGRVAEVRDHSHGRSDSLSSLPAHPAYIPRAASRTSTPTPPPPSYNPFEGRPASRSSQTPSPPRLASPPRQTSPSRQASPPRRPAPPNDFILPPPPPRAKRVPDMVVPSPQGRTPKKYTPPTIVIDSPVEARSQRFVKVTA